MPDPQPVGGDLVERLLAARMLVGGEHNGQVVSRPDPLAQEAATTIEALRSDVETIRANRDAAARGEQAALGLYAIEKARAEAAERALEELKAEAVEVVEWLKPTATGRADPCWCAEWHDREAHGHSAKCKAAAAFLSKLQNPEGGDIGDGGVK